MKTEGTGHYLRGTGALCKPRDYNREGRKDGDGETASRATSQDPGTGHRARLNCWPGLLLRETKGGEDTEKLSWRQQETGGVPVAKKQEGCLSPALSSLLVKQERGSLGAAQDCRDSEPPPGE